MTKVFVLEIPIEAFAGNCLTQKRLEGFNQKNTGIFDMD